MRQIDNSTDTERETLHLKGMLADNKAQPQPAQQWYGAYDEGGNLRATFDSPSEAYHYTQNRGHMHGGSDKPIVNHADKLAEALRGMMDAFAWKAKYTPANELQSDVRRAMEALAAYEVQSRQADDSPSLEKPWSQIRCEELQQWYEQACAGREQAKAHADKLAEALRGMIARARGETMFSESEWNEIKQTLAAYESEVR